MCLYLYFLILTCGIDFLETSEEFFSSKLDHHSPNQIKGDLDAISQNIGVGGCGGVVVGGGVGVGGDGVSADDDVVGVGGGGIED